MNYAHLKEVAIKLVAEHGLINLTRVAVCEESGVTTGSFAFVAGMTFSAFIEMLRKEGHTGPSKSVARSRASSPKLREVQILTHATEMACEVGYTNLSRQDIADKSGVSVALVARYLGTLTKIKRAVMRDAVKRKIIPVVAQGLAAKDKHAAKAGVKLKAKAIEYLLEH